MQVFAFAPFSWAPIGLLSISAFFYLCMRQDRLIASRLGFFYGLAMFGAGVNWLHISINLFGGVNLFGAWFITFILISYLALYPALFAYLTLRYFTGFDIKGPLLLFPALWTLLEWLRGWVLTGFPWLNLGNSQIDMPLAGYAKILGVYGVTFMLCMSAGCLLIIFTQKTKSRRLFAIFLLFGIWLIGYFLNQQPFTQQTDKTWQVALIQAAIPQTIKWSPNERHRTLQYYLELSEPYWHYDFLIWPETAIPYFYDKRDVYIRHLDFLTAKHGSQLLTGIAYKDLNKKKFFNSVLLIGEQHQFYHKQHLVPFGEFLPLATILRPIMKFLHIPMSDFSPREGEQVILDTGKGLIGVSICYEDVYGQEIIKSMPTAELLVNVSNDAWFGDAIAPHQHLQIARMRALETGRYLLRATNTGISAVIDEQGRIVETSQQSKPDTLHADVSGFTGYTPYAFVGNIPIIIICWVLCCVFWLKRYLR